MTASLVVRVRPASIGGGVRWFASFCLAVGAALALVSPTLASERHPTLMELEGEVICLTCHESLDQSTGPLADRERALIRHWIAAGDTKSQIEQKLVAQFGPQILAAPPMSGFNLLAWVLPIAGVIAGALTLGYLAWWWSRGRLEARGVAAAPTIPGTGAGPGLEPELERRVDEALARFDA